MSKPNKRTQADREYQERDRWIDVLYRNLDLQDTTDAVAVIRRRDLRERKRGMAMIAICLEDQIRLFNEDLERAIAREGPVQEVRRDRVFGAKIMLGTVMAFAGPAAMRWARRQQK